MTRPYVIMYRTPDLGVLVRVPGSFSSEAEAREGIERFRHVGAVEWQPAELFSIVRRNGPPYAKD